MFRRASTLALLLSLALAARAGEAQAAGRLAAFRATRMAAAQIPPAAALPAPETVQAGPAVIGPAVYVTQPPLSYRHRVFHAGWSCYPTAETVLTAISPCTCCPVAIPVCVPTCCQGAPSVSYRGARFCAGVVDFVWSNGYRVTARFRYDGQVTVVTPG